MVWSGAPMNGHLRATHPFRISGRHARLYNEAVNLGVVGAPVSGAKNWTNVYN